MCTADYNYRSVSLSSVSAITSIAVENNGDFGNEQAHAVFQQNDNRDTGLAIRVKSDVTDIEEFVSAALKRRNSTSSWQLVERVSRISNWIELNAFTRLCVNVTAYLLFSLLYLYSIFLYKMYQALVFYG